MHIMQFNRVGVRRTPRCDSSVRILNTGNEPIGIPVIEYIIVDKTKLLLYLTVTVKRVSPSGVTTYDGSSNYGLSIFRAASYGGLESADDIETGRRRSDRLKLSVDVRHGYCIRSRSFR